MGLRRTGGQEAGHARMQGAERQSISVGSSEESNPPPGSVPRPCGVIPLPVLALPRVVVSNCTGPVTVPGSCFALSYLPVLLTLLVLCLSPSL